MGFARLETGPEPGGYTNMISKIIMPALLISALAAAPAFAQNAVAALPKADSGDSAWILTASALVLMMTLPGLALFYGGLVRAKNFLSVLVQCGAVAALASVIWIVIGYSLAFSVNGNGFIGSFENVMFSGLLASIRDGQTTGELAFALFQMTFAIITPALIVGAWVERARFGWVVASRLCSRYPLGLGWRISGRSRRYRFCRRYCRAYHCWRFSACSRAHARQAHRLPQNAHVAPQPCSDGRRGRIIMGGLVWL